MSLIVFFVTVLPWSLHVEFPLDLVKLRSMTGLTSMTSSSGSHFKVILMLAAWQSSESLLNFLRRQR